MTLPTTLTEEDIIAEPSNAGGAPDLPALGSPEHTATLPPSSEMITLLETTTAPLSSPTTGLVSTGMIQVISFHVYFPYIYILTFFCFFLRFR